MSGHSSVTAEPDTRPQVQRMNEQSFIRFGGVAGILLAVTSWASVVEYFALVPKAQQLPVTDVNAYLVSLHADPTGTLIFNGLYALLAFWALVGLIASYYRLRETAEAWAFFATLVAAVASVGTIANGLYQLANLRYLGSLATSNPPDALVTALYNAPLPTNPVGIMTFGLTGVWFLVVAVLMLRANLPKLLAVIGFVAVADLFFGFIASLAGNATLPTYAALIAGGVGGPIFWLWHGILLLRHKA
ncbi:MAG TPA: hypothetical protein VKT82_02895 [Ktedonobacterales bacterium]|nr:hypothetical protein [Ktedonobacterales bacterium]